MYVPGDVPPLPGRGQYAVSNRDRVYVMVYYVTPLYNTYSNVVNAITVEWTATHV